MTYFFILGNNPNLSIAELESVLHTEDLVYIKQQNICLYRSELHLDAKSLINRLGGTIKIGEIVNNDLKKDKLLGQIRPLLNPKKGKYQFGFSVYSKRKFDLPKLAMGIKKFLKEEGHSSRWVTSKERQLSSVVVEQNKMLENGIELLFIQDKNCHILGRTLAVQAFKDLSFRDYNRPARDDKSGMLPPKLAQIMINLSGGDITKTILDPFCGSGTIINEAVLMGYKKIFATDASPKAIIDTKKNLEWLLDNYFRNGQKIEKNNLDVKILQENARTISKRLGGKSIDTIITEPFLGPQRGSIDIKRVQGELNELYTVALSQFHKILNDTGTVIMIWPIIIKNKKLNFIDPDIKSFKLCSLIHGSIKKHLPPNARQRNSLIYGRNGQKIWREIVKLQK